MPKLSRYGILSQQPSPVNRMMSEFASDFRDAIDVNLGVGYVNEDTIPRHLIKEALDSVLGHPEKHDKALNYGGARGSANLHEAIKQFYLRDTIGKLTEEIFAKKEIVIGVSGATSILEGIAQLLEPGIIVTGDPLYYIYANVLERMGYEILAVPEDHDGIQVDILEEKIHALGDRLSELRFFYIVTVSNPTSTILRNDRRKKIVEIAREVSERLNDTIPVFFDSAYENLVHNPEVPAIESGLIHDTSNLCYEISTLSKILAPALRIGYVIGPPGEILRGLVQKVSDTGFSAPLIMQEMACYLLDLHVREQVNRVNAGYRKKAKAVKEWIDTYLGEYLECYTGGDAGFYYYLTFKSIETHEKSPFFAYLSRTTGDVATDGPSHNKNPRVIYIPGEFCVYSRGDLVSVGKRQLRLSYGFEHLENIKRGIMLMAEAAEKAVPQ